MAPNQNVAKAFIAMKSLGISEATVKPVLKDLVKLYEKNWDFIEAENYRALLDAIFEKQEGQVAEPQKRNLDADSQASETQKKRRNEDLQVVEIKKKHRNAVQEEGDEEAEVHGEPDRPLKRLRLRYQDNHVSSSSGCSISGMGVNPKHLQLHTVNNSQTLLKPKDEPDSLPLHSENAKKRGDGVPDSSGGRKTNCDIANIVDESSSKLEIASTDSGEVKISMTCIPPHGRPDFHMPSLDELFKMTEGKFLRSYKFLDPSFSVKQILNELCECALELGTSSSKKSQEEKSDSPADELLSRSTPMDVEAVRKEPLTPDDSLHTQDPAKVEESGILCLPLTPDGMGHIQDSAQLEECGILCLPLTPDGMGHIQDSAQLEESGILCLPPTSNGMGHTQDSPLVDESGILCLPPISSGMGHETHSVTELSGNICGVDRENEQNDMENDNSRNLMVVEHVKLTPLLTTYGISKGLESVVVSVANEVNNELPPAFRYMPNNIKFENADVSFSLARVGNNFCSTCVGDCVTNPCACARVAGGVVYTVEGRLKEDFLEECISMIHDSRKQSFFYCKDCPLERSKVEDAKEGCKGHLMRKFIKECWWKCGCNGNCGNRVVQRGIRRNLQVFMSPKGKGWGLRTLEDLPKGTFVCEFVGEILTTAELQTRVSQASNTEKYEFPLLLDADWSAKVMKDEEALCLDAVDYGNVARFINHCCFDANLVGIPVEVDTPDHHYYRFALFTTRKVHALEELTRDYGIDFDDHGDQFKTFECLCESKFCRNLRRKTRSRSAKKRGT